MRVAVIVPVLDEAALLEALVPRLERLASKAEVVVVDGGSSDGTATVLAARGLRVVTAPRGRASQMNAGATATTAPILLFLHADTELPRDAVASVERAIEGGAVGGCFRLRIDSRDPRLRLASAFINARSSLMPSATGDQAIFVTREVFEAVGRYAELALCEDLDLVARIRQRGRLSLLDGTAVTSARRWERRGVWRTIALMWAVRIGCHVGVDPERLRRLYADAR